MVAHESAVNQNTDSPCLECKTSWALVLVTRVFNLVRSMYTKPNVERESSFADNATIRERRFRDILIS